MIYGMATLVCFLSSVQRMSLAAKCSRARANMINREQRLQAGVGVEWWGWCWAFAHIRAACEKRALVQTAGCGTSRAGWWGGGVREGDSGGREGGRKEGLFPHKLPLEGWRKRRREMVFQGSPVMVD